MEISNIRYSKPANSATRTAQEARICYGKSSGKAVRRELYSETYKNMQVVKCTISGHYRIEYNGMPIMVEVKTKTLAKKIIDRRFAAIVA